MFGHTHLARHTGVQNFMKMKASCRSRRQLKMPQHMLDIALGDGDTCTLNDAGLASSCCVGCVSPTVDCLQLPGASTKEKRFIDITPHANFKFRKLNFRFQISNLRSIAASARGVPFFEHTTSATRCNTRSHTLVDH